MVDRATYNQDVTGSNLRPGEAVKTGSGYDHSSCSDDKPIFFFLDNLKVFISVFIFLSTHTF